MELNESLQKMVNRLDLELQEVQKRCSARTYTKKDIIETIKTLQKHREYILNTPIDKKYFKKANIRKEYTVPNSYGYFYNTNTNFISGYITRYGAIKLSVGRYKADNKPYGGEKTIVEPIFE